MANKDSQAESSEDPMSLLDTVIQVNITEEEMKVEVKDEMQYLFVKTESLEPFHTTSRHTPNRCVRRFANENIFQGSISPGQECFDFSMRTSQWPGEDKIIPSCKSSGMNDIQDLLHKDIHGEHYVKVELSEEIGGNDARAEVADETLQTEIEKKMARKAAKKANPEYLQNRKKKHLRRKEEQKKLKRAEREARVQNPRSLQNPSSSATLSQCREECHPREATMRIAGSVGNTPQLTFFRRQYITKELGTVAVVNQEALPPLFPEAIPAGAVRHLADTIRTPLFSQPTLLGAPPSVSVPLMGQLPAPFHRASDVSSPQAYGLPPTNPYLLPAHVQLDCLPNHRDQGGYERDRSGRNRNNPGNQFDRDGATSYRDGRNEGLGRCGVPYSAVWDRQCFPSTRDNNSAKQTPLTRNSPPRIQRSPWKTKVEQEKADFILQVLRLREEVIAEMAPEQQITVRTLQEQFRELLK